MDYLFYSIPLQKETSLLIFPKSHCIKFYWLRSGVTTTCLLSTRKWVLQTGLHTSWAVPVPQSPYTPAVRRFPLVRLYSIYQQANSLGPPLVAWRSSSAPSLDPDLLWSTVKVFPDRQILPDICVAVPEGPTHSAAFLILWSEIPDTIREAIIQP